MHEGNLCLILMIFLVKMHNNLNLREIISNIEIIIIITKIITANLKNIHFIHLIKTVMMDSTKKLIIKKFILARINKLNNKSNFNRNINIQIYLMNLFNHI